MVPAPRGSSRGCFGVFSWLVASSAFGKLQSQQTAGPGGRVQPRCENFDMRAFCKEAVPAVTAGVQRVEVLRWGDPFCLAWAGAEEVLRGEASVLQELTVV